MYIGRLSPQEENGPRGTVPGLPCLLSRQSHVKDPQIQPSWEENTEMHVFLFSCHLLKGEVIRKSTKSSEGWWKMKKRTIPALWIALGGATLFLILLFKAGIVEKWLWMRPRGYAEIFWKPLSIKWALFGLAFGCVSLCFWISLRFVVPNAELSRGLQKLLRNTMNNGSTHAATSPLLILHRPSSNKHASDVRPFSAKTGKEGGSPGYPVGARYQTR